MEFSILGTKRKFQAFGMGVGAVLMQHDRPLAYMSQTIQGKALLVYEKKLMALVLAVKK